MILHSHGDPWDGCVVRILSHHTAHVFRCRLPSSQRPFAKSRRAATRLLHANDLF